MSANAHHAYHQHHEPMIARFFPHFLTWTRRRWGYAFCEVVFVAIFGLAGSSLLGNSSRIGLTVPGMAPITAGCLLAASVAMFILVVCVKQIDMQQQGTP